MIYKQSMATKKFILQGLSSNTHATAIKELYDIANIKSVVLSIAFISDNGVKLIENELTSHSQNTTIFAGIRNNITSHQGLARLFNAGCSIYAVDTGARTIVFHPKLYLVKGKHQAKLLIGSANLTLGGLNNNIEAGMLLDFDLNNSDDNAVITDIEQQLNNIPSEHPENVIKISSLSMINDLLVAGRLSDEDETFSPHPNASKLEAYTLDAVTRIKLKTPALRLTIQNPIGTHRKSKYSKKPAESQSLTPPQSTGVELALVWESKPLTRRDLTIPDTSGTHSTGSINLDKGRLSPEIDHRHYFRDTVFGHLKWSAKNSTVDEAYAKFHLILKNISLGEFDLPIRHTHSTTSKSYLQRNAMTRLSWGPMSEYIARPDLINRTLSLYCDYANPQRFVLEID